MKKIIIRYFHKGVDHQKRADIVMLLSMPESKVIKNWSLEQKITALAFVNDIQGKFDDFKNRLENSLKQ